MPAPTKRRLYGPDGWATVRSAVAAADDPAWTPALLPDPDGVTLDAREWAAVLLVANRTTTVHVLFRRSAADGALSWERVAAVDVTATVPVRVTVDGHIVAFRVAAVVLGPAETLDLRVTGGTALVSDQRA